jgi:hypothetical protein
MRRRSGALIVALGLVACSREQTVRLDVPSDTLVINTTLWTAIPGRAVSSDGSVANASVTYSSDDTVLLATRGNAAACHDNGVTNIRLRTIRDEARIVVHCRLVRHFGPPQVVELIAGGPGVPLAITTYDADGNEMNGISLPVTVRDTSVIKLRNGMVYGIRPGATGITTGSSGKTGGGVFFVRARPVDSLVR